MKGAIEKEYPNQGAPHETLLVVDGSVGRNAVEQASAWRKYVGVTGLAVTKLDGTARGGFVVSVVKDQQLPVKFIGVGEGIEDLRDFDPVQFVDALLGVDGNAALDMKARAGKILQVSGEQSRVSTSRPSEAQGEGRAGDPAARLMASFGGASSGTGDGGGLGTLESSFTAANAPAGKQAGAAENGGAKRKKRPKPQQSNKKKRGKK